MAKIISTFDHLTEELMLFVVLEKTLESPLDCKEIQPVHSKDQPEDFFGRNDAKAETPVLWPPHAKSWLMGKDSDAGRDWGQEEKGTTEDEMAGWHHWLDGHEFWWTPGVGDGQEGLACCGSWGRKESGMTERLNWTEMNHYVTFYKFNNKSHSSYILWKEANHYLETPNQQFLFFSWRCSKLENVFYFNRNYFLNVSGCDIPAWKKMRALLTNIKSR